MSALDIAKDPAKTALGKRQQLSEVADAPDDQVKNLDPKVVKDIAKTGADAMNGDTKDDGDKKTDDEKSSLKIRIDLNLDVEIHLTARIEGHIVIGLL